MSRENVDLVRRMLELFDRRESARTVDFFDPDVEFARIGDEFADLAGEWRGVEAMWAAIMRFLRAWDDLRHEFEEVIDLGDRVLALVKQIARGRASRVSVEREVAFLFAFRHGKIVRWEVYWHRADALRAGGVTA